MGSEERKSKIDILKFFDETTSVTSVNFGKRLLLNRNGISISNRFRPGSLYAQRTGQI